VTNGFAAERDVILVDYPGIGGSSGETPSTVAPLTKACVEFCRALNLTQFDIVGFSLGGMIAQQLAAPGAGRPSAHAERREQFSQAIEDFLDHTTTEPRSLDGGRPPNAKGRADA
jgi:alpha/beta hydrolase fold